MAISPDDTTRTGGETGCARGERPVLGGASTAVTALAGCMPQRLWALSDAEVAQAMTTLGALAGSVDAHLVAVLAEAKRRSLGAGQGWGPVDWAQAMAPLLPARHLRDLDIVAAVAASEDRRLSEVLEAVAAAATATVDTAGARALVRGTLDDATNPDDAMNDQADADEADTDHAGGDVAGGMEAGDAVEVLPVGKAAQIVRFHQGIRGMADPVTLHEVTGFLLGSARGEDGLCEKGLAAAVRHAGQVMRPDRLVEHDADVRRAHRSLVKGPDRSGCAGTP